MLGLKTFLLAWLPARNRQLADRCRISSPGYGAGVSLCNQSSMSWRSIINFNNFNSKSCEVSGIVLSLRSSRIQSLSYYFSHFHFKKELDNSKTLSTWRLGLLSQTFCVVREFFIRNLKPESVLSKFIFQFDVYSPTELSNTLELLP